MYTTFSFCYNLHFQGKGSLVNNSYNTSLTNLILSSLVSEFRQRIQIQEKIKALQAFHDAPPLRLHQAK